MPHLAVFREGWTNERFAEFVLSQICFISRPSSIGDDIGADFNCTMFERMQVSKNTELLPRSSFVVQVKSRSAPISLTKHVGYLARLEVPFFVAVPDRRKAKLEIYSGRFLPYMFALKGPNLASLTVRLTRAARTTLRSLRGSVSGGPKRVTVAMPRIAAIPVRASAADYVKVGGLLEKECQETGLNTYHRLTNQFVFTYSAGKVRSVLAGPGSSLVFRANFADRFLEYCRNVIWLRQHRRGQISDTELTEVLTVADAIDHRLPPSASRERALRVIRKFLERPSNKSVKQTRRRHRLTDAGRIASATDMKQLAGRAAYL